MFFLFFFTLAVSSFFTLGAYVIFLFILLESTQPLGALALVLCATGVEARCFSLSSVTSESNLESFSLW